MFSKCSLLLFSLVVLHPLWQTPCSSFSNHSATLNRPQVTSGLRSSYSWIFLVTQLEGVSRLSGASCLSSFIKTITFSAEKTLTLAIGLCGWGSKRTTLWRWPWDLSSCPFLLSYRCNWGWWDSFSSTRGSPRGPAVLTFIYIQEWHPYQGLGVSHFLETLWLHVHLVHRCVWMVSRFLWNFETWRPKYWFTEGNFPFSGAKLWSFSGDSLQRCDNKAPATSNPLAVDCSNFEAGSLPFYPPVAEHSNFGKV